ncbi:hypothetical protein SCLCIDRAFT_1212055 [Scleroderma citrinum Foug A]|uniref:Uncharacterized protein n=1 Tax=Scleroderma citrinum Foug A TaxID=1036808 RepID=A0A0C3EBG5_9AGAM|nr:hypothetical protein SCLCIDRAFT_1212055 [Scleroderma citrinum Foug A]
MSRAHRIPPPPFHTSVLGCMNQIAPLMVYQRKLRGPLQGAHVSHTRSTRDWVLIRWFQTR